MSALKTGTVVLFTTGCYSDFSEVGWFIVLQDFDAKAQEALYRASCPPQVKRMSRTAEERAAYHARPTQEGYAAWLVQQALVVEINIPHTIVHLGDFELEVVE